MTTTRHRSLVERGGRKAFVGNKGLVHTKEKKGKKRCTRILKNKIRTHRA